MSAFHVIQKEQRKVAPKHNAGPTPQAQPRSQLCLLGYMLVGDDAVVEISQHRRRQKRQCCCQINHRLDTAHPERNNAQRSQHQHKEHVEVVNIDGGEEMESSLVVSLSTRG